MKEKQIIQSLDYGWDLEVMNLTEDDSLEAWHKRQGEHETESQAFFAMARARLRSAFESGLLKKELSMQQFDILHLLFNEGKTTREVADTLRTGLDNVDHQLVKAIKKLNKFFK